MFHVCVWRSVYDAGYNRGTGWADFLGYIVVVMTWGVLGLHHSCRKKISSATPEFGAQSRVLCVL